MNPANTVFPVDQFSYGQRATTKRTYPLNTAPSTSVFDFVGGPQRKSNPSTSLNQAMTIPIASIGGQDDSVDCFLLQMEDSLGVSESDHANTSTDAELATIKPKQPFPDTNNVIYVPHFGKYVENGQLKVQWKRIELS
jgi:hypothetical protein